MNLLRYYWPILIVAFFCGSANAQQKKSKTDDSDNSEIYRQYDIKLKELEKSRAADSLRRVILEEEITKLASSDNLKRRELMDQIETIKQQEITRLTQKKEQIEKLRSKIKGYPVLGFFEDTLFKIYSKAGMLSASERAQTVTQRISKLGSELLFRRDSLKIVPNENTVDVMFRDQILLSITENDAIWMNISQYDAAVFARRIIGKEVERYKKESSFSTLAKKAGLAIAVLVALLLIIIYIGRLFSFITHRIEIHKDRYLHGIHIGDYELLDVRRQLNFIGAVGKLIKWVLVIFIVYITLPLLFGIFPWTENLAGVLISYITDPTIKILQSIYEYLPKLFTILVIVIFFKYVLKALRFLRDEIERGQLEIDGFYADWAAPTFQIVRVLILAFMLVVIFPYLPGSQSPVFQGVSVFLGFLFTFGSASSLSNIISGLVLTYMRLFKIGDRIRIGDVTGDVIEKSLLVTRVKTPKNEVVSIPNSSIMNNHTTNFTTEAEGKGLIIYSTVTIGYDVPWHKMHEALIEAALRTDDIVSDPAPFVLQTGLEDFYVAYQINAYIHLASQQNRIYSALHQNIQDVCAERDIEIMSPHYRAQRDGTVSTIPKIDLDLEKKNEDGA